MVLSEKKTYIVGKDCQYGYYLFTSNYSGQDADFNRYREYPPTSTYIRSRCYFGCVKVETTDRIVRIENGRAMYLGSEPFNIYETINSTIIEDKKVSKRGDPVLVNDVCRIKVHYTDKSMHLYGGDAIVEVQDQYVFCINAHYFWTGKVITHSFKPYRCMIFSFRYGLLGKEYTIGEKGASQRGIGYISFSTDDNPVKLTRQGNETRYYIELPKDFRSSKIALDWVKPSSSTSKFHPIEERTIAEYFADDYTRLKSILTKFNELGFGIDISKELEQFDSAPDFAEICSSFLEKQYNSFIISKNNLPNQGKQYTFHIGTSYDKKYYCAVKLAEKAVSIQSNRDKTVYYVSFDESQTNDIALMYYNLVSPFNEEKDYMLEIHSFLEKRSFMYRIWSEIDRFVSELNEEYGYSGFVTGSLLIHIIKDIKKSMRRELDRLYSEMIEERRVTAKWSSEYKLFSLVHNYVPDAIYQYRCIWLGAQSFDVFLPSENVAIEYQGQQHYGPIDAFGGQESYENTVERDKRKRRLSSENGIRVLDWRYDVPVTEETVKTFLTDHGISICSEPRKEIELPSDDIILEMAPVQEKAKEKQKLVRLSPKTIRLSANVIRQFDREGHFVGEFNTVSEASSATGVTEKSIRNVVYGYRKSGGGFVWKQVERGSPIEDVSPVIQVENTGFGRAIQQIDSDGRIVCEYPSMRAASSATGVNTRSISDVLNGVQKTAGGFEWKYKDE